MLKTMKNQMLPERGEGCRCKAKPQKLLCMYVCKLNVWYYNVTHSYEVDYRLLSNITSYLYEIFMELFLSRQNDQIAPVLDTFG